MTRHILDPGQPANQRFLPLGPELAQDAATGLIWPLDADILGFPATWEDALAAVAGLNQARFLGHADWRMPNRRELRSLIDHGQKQPALPPGHPFANVFSGWYWTSTTKAGQPAYAWNVHFEGGRMFYSRKDEFRLLWPVRGESPVLPQTGQTTCFDTAGAALPCPGAGQDGELRAGVPWPSPRFEHTPLGVLDLLTGLCWADPASLPAQPVDWQAALNAAASRNAEDGPAWRLPNINELESLIDAECADPALPRELGLPLSVEGFWSSTTSGFDPAWAFVLYVQKGAVGVGFKARSDFRVWPVRTLAL